MREILLALGNVEAADNKNWSSRAQKTAKISAAGESITVIPPSWRRDLTREADLIEEVARIHGYEQIPEDVAVPMAASTRTRQDRILEKIRGVLLAAGIDEALTPSAVDRAIFGGHEPLDCGRTAAEFDARDPRGRLPAAELDPQPAGRTADQRGPVESRDRTFRNRENLSAAAGRFAR